MTDISSLRDMTAAGQHPACDGVVSVMARYDAVPATGCAA